ncbi:7481_t:CDS:2 [Ambispora leptoticha]|uniref:7481_t:CDS:1 n=1 Tax=Ambispora leptoticha TaxID=144679 RepID=A0A9N9AW11_9GLOM|nr:7481_t:CDS:2 [Ambispora leptoticha]
MGCCSSKDLIKKDENEKQYQQQPGQATSSSPKPLSRHVSLLRNGTKNSTKTRRPKEESIIVESDPLEDENNHLAKYFKRTPSTIKFSRKTTSLRLSKKKKSKSITTNVRSNSVHSDTLRYQHKQYQFEHEGDTLSINLNCFIDFNNDDKFSQISGRNVESKRATMSDVNETTVDVHSFSKKPRQHSIAHDDNEEHRESAASRHNSNRSSKIIRHKPLCQTATQIDDDTSLYSADEEETQQENPQQRPSARYLQRKGTLNRHAKFYEQRDYRKSLPQQSTTLSHYLAYDQEQDNKRRSMGNKGSHDNWDESVSRTSVIKSIDQSQNSSLRHSSMRIKGKSALRQSTDNYASFNSSTDDKQQSETRPNDQLRLSAEQVALLEKADEQFANDLLNSNLNEAYMQEDFEFVQVHSPTWSMATSDDDDETENIQFCHGQLEKLQPVEAILTPLHNIKRLSRRTSNGKRLNLSDPKLRETLIALNEDTEFNFSVPSSNKEPENKDKLPTIDVAKSLDYDGNEKKNNEMKNNERKNNKKSRNPEARPKTFYGKLYSYGESSNSHQTTTLTNNNDSKSNQLEVTRASQIKRFSAGNERPLSPNFERFISFDANGVKRVASMVTTTDNHLSHRESISTRRSKRRSIHDDEIDDYLDLGNCQQCHRPNIGVDWCKNCNAKHFAEDFSEWDSGMDEVNSFIKATQLSADNSMRIIEWISYDQFSNIENIGKGGYSIVDKATWINGRIRAWDHDYKRWSRYGNHPVVLKRLVNSKRMTLTFLNELKIQWNIVSSDMPTWFGITRDPATQDFILVMEQIDGNLHNYLQKSFSQITWISKVEILLDLTWILWTIHESGIVHQDLHSGNILWESGSPKISDLDGNLSIAKQFEDAERLRVNAIVLGDKIEQHHPEAIYTSRALPVVSESGERLEIRSANTRISVQITLDQETPQIQIESPPSD